MTLSRGSGREVQNLHSFHKSNTVRRSNGGRDKKRYNIKQTSFNIMLDYTWNTLTFHPLIRLGFSSEYGEGQRFHTEPNRGKKGGRMRVVVEEESICLWLWCKFKPADECEACRASPGDIPDGLLALPAHRAQTAALACRWCSGQRRNFLEVNVNVLKSE